MKFLTTSALALALGFVCLGAFAQEATIRKNLIERYPNLPKIDEIKTLLASRHPLVVLDSVEEDRVRDLVAAAAAQLGLPVFDAAEPFAPSAYDRETILDEAQRLVHGHRGADYGHPIEDYTRTGRMWGAILGIPDIDPRICCLMMAAVKVSRLARGLPVGGDLEYVDGVTLAHALTARQELR